MLDIPTAMGDRNMLMCLTSHEAHPSDACIALYDWQASALPGTVCMHKGSTETRMWVSTEQVRNLCAAEEVGNIVLICSPSASLT